MDSTSPTAGRPASGDAHDASDIAEFGYKQEMKREYGWYASFALAFGFVSIATGLFTTYGSVLNSSGPMGIWTWAIATLGQVAVALVFGALVARIPVSGYSYQWVSRLANPTLGWIMGWISFMFLGVVVVAVDITIASTILPVLFEYEGNTMNIYVITAIVVLLQAIMVAWSTKVTQKTNNVAVTIQVIGMIAITILLFVVGWFTGKLDWSNLFSTGAIPAENYFSLGTWTEAGPWAMGFLIGAFTIVGFESAANLSEETHDPARTIPKAMWQAVLSLGVMGMLFLIAVTATGGDMIALAQSPTPIADVINAVLGGVVGKILLVMVVISIFSCGLTISLSGARLVWAMSRDKRFPGWKVLAKVNPKTGTPLNAMVFMLIIGQVILAIFGFYSADALFALFSAATLLPALIYAGTVLLYVVKRKVLPPTKGFDLGKWEIPVLIVSSVWLIYELAIFRGESFRESWLYVLVLLAIGGVYLAFLLIRNGKAGLTMPELADIDKELDADAEAVEGKLS